MTGVHVVTLLVAVLFFLSTAVPALSQTGRTPTTTAKPAETKPAEAKTDATKPAEVKPEATKPVEVKKDVKAQKKAAKAKQKADKKAAKKGEEDKEDGERSNKGGKLRGLDRADQVAGEHGKQGRDKARAKQGR